MIEKLIKIIGREATLFESFLELLEKQQRMLVENNLDGLNQVTAEQREKMTESQLLNNKRLELVEQIKADKHIQGDLNVTKLLEIVDLEQADRLAKLQHLILSLNDKITETRNQNAILLNRSREYIAKTMEMLSRINSHESTYDQNGTSKEHHANIVIDRRV